MLSNPIMVKTAALILLGFLKLAAGLSPMIFSEVLKSYGERRVKAATSLALCFGGGVLLASCMLHMIPKVREDMTLLEWQTPFPAAEFIVCCGFFVVYLVEELVLSFTRDTNFRSAEAELRINGRVGPTPPDVLKTDSVPPERTHHVLILSALSLHSALEGLALGLQPTPRAVWMLFAAILIHAAIVLFSMGLKLVSDGSSEVQIILYMTVSALSSPVGGSIGLAATSDDERVHAGALVTLQGLAAGAVLFVTFFEVLEKEKRKGGFLRFFCVVLGFAVMVGLQILVGHDQHRKSKKSSQGGDALLLGGLMQVWEFWGLSEVFDGVEGSNRRKEERGLGMKTGVRVKQKPPSFLEASYLLFYGKTLLKCTVIEYSCVEDETNYF